MYDADYARMYRQKNHEMCIKATRAWRKKNLVRDRENSKRWYRTHVEKARTSLRIWSIKSREKRYGVSYPTWWLCDGCSKPISLWKSEIHLDHDHKTGKFRAWLCIRCNAGLGVLDKLENWQIVQLLKLVKVSAILNNEKE